jgi:hypothetical protein
VHATSYPPLNSTREDDSFHDISCILSTEHGTSLEKMTHFMHAKYRTWYSAREDDSFHKISCMLCTKHGTAQEKMTHSLCKIGITSESHENTGRAGTRAEGLCWKEMMEILETEQ